MSCRHRRWIWLLVGMALTCVAYQVVQRFADRLAAHESGTNISLLGSILVVEKPVAVDRASLVTVLARHQHDESVLLDGWGNPLIVSVSDSIPPSYTVVSFARDGVRGSCCEKFVQDLDDDLVWRDGAWLQVFTSDSQ